jgi:hypothetical protein
MAAQCHIMNGEDERLWQAKKTPITLPESTSLVARSTMYIQLNVPIHPSPEVLVLQRRDGAITDRQTR